METISDILRFLFLEHWEMTLLVIAFVWAKINKHIELEKAKARLAEYKDAVQGMVRAINDISDSGVRKRVKQEVDRRVNEGKHVLDKEIVEAEASVKGKRWARVAEEALPLVTKIIKAVF